MAKAAKISCRVATSMDMLAMAKPETQITQIMHGRDVDERPEVWLTDPNVGEMLIGLEDIDLKHRLLFAAYDAIIPDNLESSYRNVSKEDGDAMRHGLEDLGNEIRTLRAQFQEYCSKQRIERDPSRARRHECVETISRSGAAPAVPAPG